MSIFKPQFIKESEYINNMRSVINEAYYGDKCIEPILKQLHKLRTPYLEKMKQSPIKYSYFINDFNNNPELFKLNRMIEDFFGFKLCSFTLTNSYILNAQTIPISYRHMATGKNLISTSNGFKFKKEAEYCLILIMYSGVVLNPEFTDREIMGAMLHEIGHNFSAAINNQLSAIKDIQRIVDIPLRLFVIVSGLVTFNINWSDWANNLNSLVERSPKIKKYTILCTNKLREENKETMQFIDNINSSSNFVTFVKEFISNIRVNIKIFTDPMHILTSNIESNLKKYTNPFNIFFGIGGKTDEIMADDFAVMYGYGEDNNSFLVKIEEMPSTTNKIASIPVLGILQQAIIIPIELIVYTFDPHPKTIERILNSIEYLELELNNSTSDPKMKKEIQRQIDDLYKLLNKYKSVDWKFRGTDLRKIYINCCYGVYSNTPGNRIENLYDIIDKKK